MQRCKWCNLKNDIYVTYHDTEWGVLNLDEKYLFEMLVLESFQAGLSWECILNKRKDFQKAYENFDLQKVCNFDENKIKSLLENDEIIKNKLKILASQKNAKVFAEIQKEFGGFKNFLLSFSGNKIFYETGKTTSPLSDKISKELKKRGMKFVGSITIYSFLQAVGIVNSHEPNCFLFKKQQ